MINETNALVRHVVFWSSRHYVYVHEFRICAAYTNFDLSRTIRLRLWREGEEGDDRRGVSFPWLYASL